MKEARLQITPGMRRFLDYPKFAGPTRMLVLTTEYFFDESWLRAAESLGWEAATVRSVMTGALTRDDIAALFKTIGTFKPDFILTSNYAGMDMAGMFARFFEDARIPYVSWFTDTPRMILYQREVYCSDYAVAATWERAYTRHFEELGFQHIHYMPLATDPALFHGAPLRAWARPLAFVGTSMIEQATEAWEKLAEAPEAKAEVERAFAERRVDRERFAQGIQAILDPALIEQADARTRRHAELCLVYEATRRARAALVKRLEPLGLEVFGDEHWRQVTARAQGGIGYFSDLAAFYRTTGVNVNATSLQMRWAVNQRVFDCPAAGGFLISDRQGDLEHLFDPDTEVVTFGDLDELEDKVRYYLDHPEARLPIITAAQRRIAARHTHAHRLEDLEAFLKARYA